MARRPSRIVACFVALRLLRAHGIALKPKLWTLSASALVALVPAAPWMLRAFADTGYPLSPLPVQVLGHTLGVASPMLRWYGERDVTGYTWTAEREALSRVSGKTIVCMEITAGSGTSLGSSSGIGSEWIDRTSGPPG